MVCSSTPLFRLGIMSMTSQSKEWQYTPSTRAGLRVAAHGIQECFAVRMYYKLGRLGSTVSFILIVSPLSVNDCFWFIVNYFWLVGLCKRTMEENRYQINNL